MLRKTCCTAALLFMAWSGAAHAQQGVALTGASTDFSTWSTFGSASKSGNRLELTAPGIGDQAGAAFAPQAIALDFGQAFSFSFNFRIAGDQVRGDGLTFTLAAAPEVGDGGSGLGYQGLGNSVAFAIDTFHFGGEAESPSLQILRNGDVSPIAVTTTGLGDDIRTASPLLGRLDYAPTTNGQGMLTGSILYGAQTFSVSTAVDLRDLGNTVYYGFTASNGLATDGHFIVSAAPVPEPSTYAMMLVGMVLLAGVARRRMAPRTGG